MSIETPIVTSSEETPRTMAAWCKCGYDALVIEAAALERELTAAQSALSRATAERDEARAETHRVQRAHDGIVGDLERGWNREMDGCLAERNEARQCEELATQALGRYRAVVEIGARLFVPDNEGGHVPQKAMIEHIRQCMRLCPPPAAAAHEGTGVQS